MTDSTVGSFIDYAMRGAATAHGNEPSSYRSSHLGDGDHPGDLPPRRVVAAPSLHSALRTEENYPNGQF
jgi:hypothetical protein